MNSPSDRGRRLASTSPSPTVSAGGHLPVVGRRRSSSSKRLIAVFPSIDSADRSAVEVVGLGIVGEHLVGGLLGLLDAQSQDRQGLPPPVRGRRDRRRRRLRPAWTGPILSRNSAPAVRRCFLPMPGHPGQRGDVAVGERVPQRRARRTSPAWPARSRARRPDTPSRVRNRSRASASAKPYSVIESSRTIIAVISRASLAAPQRRQRRRGRHHLVADAGGLDDDVVEGDVEDLTAHRRDHRPPSPSP